MPPGVWKPLIMTMGRSGRIFSRRIRAAAACDQRPLRGELGAVGQGDLLQVVERLAGVDQGELKMIVLERDDHRGGVQPEDLGEVGALDAPRLAGGDGLLLEVGEQVPGPLDLDLGDQLLAQAGDLLDQVVPPLDAVEGPGIHAPVLVHAEVGIGGHEQGVVLGGLDVALPRNRGPAARPAARRRHRSGSRTEKDPSWTHPGRHRRRNSSRSARSGCPC